MKRIIITGAVAAIAAVSFAGTASAAPADAACFGGIHKTVNTKGFAGFVTVGELVQSPLAEANGGKGQGKNAVARSLCS